MIPPSTLAPWRWVAISLGAGMALWAALTLRLDPGLPSFERSGLRASALAGLTLVVLGFLVPRVAVRIGLALPGPDAPRDPTDLPARLAKHPYATLFIASFVALFVEILLIRYTGSQIRVFAYFKNIPLIASFLGLGLGLWLGRGATRSALSFLLWLLPFTVFLTGGAPIVDGYLGTLTAVASSEQVLGDLAFGSASAPARIVSQLLVGGFCVAVLVAVMLLFSSLGRLLADAFARVPRLPGYTVNILGSLLGILAFTALSFLQTPPWVWLLAGLLPLLWWTASRREWVPALLLLALSVVASTPSQGDTRWSPYQKLVGRPASLPGPGGGQADGYLVQLSDVFYQLAIDLRPDAIQRYGFNPYPHYDAAFDSLSRLDRVVIVGTGTGNDVAAALRAGAGRIDAVEIDPAIVSLGREHHPEDPYASSRVRVIVADARRAFRSLRPGSYDAVVFGLLDSHTQLGMSSLRLDNYVFTLESFASAASLLKPGGRLIVTAAIFRPWFGERVRAMVSTACGGRIEERVFGAWASYRCRVDPTIPAAATESGAVLPTDDWPFLYLESRGIPGAYVLIVGVLALVSMLVLLRSGLRLERFTSYHGHLFFLGAAFLLMEVYAINRLALIFGTTWLVSAITIALVLSLIVLANLTVMWRTSIDYRLAYVALALALVVSFSLRPELFLERPTLVQYAYGLAVLSPLYFAGIIFARSFRGAEVAGAALGANILGSGLGGWLEYSTMALGIRSMVLLAAALYLASLVSIGLHLSRNRPMPSG